MVRSLDPRVDKVTKMRPLVPAVDRAGRILAILKCRRDGCGVIEIARMIDASKGTVSEILATLEQHELVQRNRDTKKYRLGYALLELGRAVLRDIDQMHDIHQHIRRLMDLTGGTVIVTVLDGGWTMIIDRVLPETRLHVYAPIGRRDPAVAGSMGKLLLAYVDENELDAILDSQGLPKFTENSVTEKAAYKSMLQHIREVGYAVDNEEFIEGAKGVSAPIKDHRGKVIAALTVTGSTTWLSDTRTVEIIRQTVEMTNLISSDLGAPSLG